MPPKIFILLIIPNLIEFANANSPNNLLFFYIISPKIKTFPQNRKAIPNFILPVPVTRWIKVEKSRQFF